MQFLSWLEGLDISQWVAGSNWGYPIVLCCHSIGMAIVVGVVLMLSLRVLGYSAGIPLAAFNSLLNVAWAGFAVNAVSGVLLFMANGTNLIGNWTFLLKIALIAIGGVLLLYLWRGVRIQPAGLEGGTVFTPSLKALAVANMVCWLGAITSGRYIAYTLSAALEASFK